MEIQSKTVIFDVRKKHVMEAQSKNEICMAGEWKKKNQDAELSLLNSGRITYAHYEPSEDFPGLLHLSFSRRMKCPGSNVAVVLATSRTLANTFLCSYEECTGLHSGGLLLPRSRYSKEKRVKPKSFSEFKNIAITRGANYEATST